MLDIFYMIICRLLLTFYFCIFLLSLPDCLHHSGLKVQIVFVHFDNGRFVSCFDNCHHSIRQLVWKTDRRTRRRRQREGRREGGMEAGGRRKPENLYFLSPLYRQTSQQDTVNKRMCACMKERQKESFQQISPQSFRGKTGSA